MKIEKVDLKDYQEIVKLNEKNNLISLEQADWENLWTKNPIILEKKVEWIKGWKLINENREIEGLILNIPFEFKFKNERIIAAVCNNYVLNKSKRSFSLKLRHLFLNQSNVNLYITNTANKKSEEIMLAFKAKRIIQYDYQNRLIYILNKRKFLSKILSNLHLLLNLKNIKKLLKNKKEYEITNISFQEYKDFSNIDDLEKINLNNFFFIISF